LAITYLKQARKDTPNATAGGSTGGETLGSPTKMFQPCWHYAEVKDLKSVARRTGSGTTCLLRGVSRRGPEWRRSSGKKKRTDEAAGRERKKHSRLARRKKMLCSFTRLSCQGIVVRCFRANER